MIWSSAVIINHHSPWEEQVEILAPAPTPTPRFLTPDGNFCYQALLGLQRKGLFSIVLHQKFSPINNRHTRHFPFPPHQEKGRTAKLARSYSLLLYMYPEGTYKMKIFLKTRRCRFEVSQSVPKLTCLM